jgi:glycosyltransferase involved in cell wall biosynthesis
MSTLPLVSVITPSFNKHEFVLEAIDSVLEQTHPVLEYWIIENSNDGITREIVKKKAKTDDRIIYLEMDFTGKERRMTYIPAEICNAVYPEVNGKYIFYLSDDDLLFPQSLDVMVDFMERYNIWVSYHSQEKLIPVGNGWIRNGAITAEFERGQDSLHPIVDCHLDGGQVMHRSQCLSKLQKPYFDTTIPTAHHCDGKFLQKLAEHYKFYPVPTKEFLSVHRVTPKSTWQRS